MRPRSRDTVRRLSSQYRSSRGERKMTAYSQLEVLQAPPSSPKFLLAELAPPSSPNTDMNFRADGSGTACRASLCHIFASLSYTCQRFIRNVRQSELLQRVVLKAARLGITQRGLVKVEPGGKTRRNSRRAGDDLPVSSVFGRAFS
jgi:hypothetical protein